jgi:hypothetical protein
MKTVTEEQVKNINLFYGNILTAEELAEETYFINKRVTNPGNWSDEVKSGAEIAHHYALERCTDNE